MEWQPVETAVEGFYLAYEDGAMRTMYFDGEKWEQMAVPVMLNEWGDQLVSSDVERTYGKKLALSDCVSNPTHYMVLPEPPV